jgi:hypothetical protein
MMPSAKIESCSSAPPEKRLKRPNIVPPICSKKFRITSGLIPGVTTCAPSR